MNVLAAFIFFTRLPFWRIRQVPPESFMHVVNYWSFVGWLTGGIMAGVLGLSALVFPLPVAVLLAIISRLLLTGALHEDGLSDFFDGFGGGTDRERILVIMKDSHAGCYGIIGLIIYFLLLYTLLSSLPISISCLVIVAGDPLSKFIASQLVNVLPYARKEEESKIKVIYNRMSVKNLLYAIFCGVLPLLILLPLTYQIAALFPVITFFLLYLLMKKRLGGYTGDCCGAVFLLCEITFYLGIVALHSHSLTS